MLKIKSIHIIRWEIFVRTLIAFLVLTTLNTEASFKELSKEFLRENASVQNLLGNSLKADQGIKLVESTLAARVDGGVSYVDNNSDSANDINFAAGRTTSLDLNFTKPTSWGGVFSLNNSFEKVIQDPTRLRAFGGDPEIHQFIQTLSFSTSLTRNVLGKEFHLNFNRSLMNAEFVDLLSQNSVNDLFLQFGRVYTSAVLNRELFNLQTEALARANKRLTLVRRRVSDGISLKADLYRAESAKIFQEEQLDQARQDYNQSLYTLSNLLHRTIVDADLDEMSGIDPLMQAIIKNTSMAEKSSLLVNTKRRNADQLEIEKDLLSRSMLPEVELSLGYQTNDYDADSSNVFERGNIIGDKNTLSIGLTFSYNLGRISEKARLREAVVNHNQALHELSAGVKEQSDKRVLLNSNIELSRSNKNKAKKRVALSNSIIKEYVKLFSLGRVTLDQVIQAEEDLINSQRRLAQQIVLNFNQKLELVGLDYFLPNVITENKL